MVGLSSKTAITDDETKALLLSTGKKLCMHIVASSPSYIHKKDIPQSIVDTEMSIFKEQSVRENEALPENKRKNETQLERIVAGE